MVVCDLSPYLEIEMAVVSDWQHMSSTLWQVVKVERNVMFIILTLIILIAAFNIVSGLIMLVRVEIMC